MPPFVRRKLRLAGLVYDTADMAPLTAQQRVALFSVVHAVEGIPKSLPNVPGTAIRHDLAVLCAIGTAGGPPPRP